MGVQERADDAIGANQEPQEGTEAEELEGTFRVRRHPSPVWRKKMMERMPNTDFSVETMCKRIITVLVKGQQGGWMDYPVRTDYLMKAIGLRGIQVKDRRFILRALKFLLRYQIIQRQSFSPKLYGIHPRYEPYKPRICYDTR